MWNSVNREHGPYRRPMGGAQSAVSFAATVRWTRSTLARPTRGSQRGALDLAHGCSLARSTESLSALADLSSSFSALAAFWSAVEIAPETRPRPTRPDRKSVV